MPLDPTHVYDLAAAVLDSVVDGFADAGVTLPDRQYVHAGEVAFDCEQVVVSVVRLTHSFPDQSAKIEFCSPPRHVTIEVFVVRCVPGPADNGDPPTTEALDTAAQAELADLWTLAYVLWASYKTGWGGQCATALFGPVETVGPEGGHGAVKATVNVLIV